MHGELNALLQDSTHKGDMTLEFTIPTAFFFSLSKRVATPGILSLVLLGVSILYSSVSYCRLPSHLGIFLSRHSIRNSIDNILHILSRFWYTFDP